jgi:hypothetical protein
MLGNMPGWHWATERVDEFSTGDLRVICEQLQIQVLDSIK